MRSATISESGRPASLMASTTCSQGIMPAVAVGELAEVVVGRHLAAVGGVHLRASSP